MPDRQQPPRLASVLAHANGEEEVDIDWEDIKKVQLPRILAKCETIADRGLEVFQQIGAIHGAAERCEKAAMRNEAATKRCEAAVERFEALVKQHIPSTPPPAPPPLPPKMRDRLPSYVEEHEDDDTAIKELKKKYRDDIAVKAAYARNVAFVRNAALLIIALAAVAGILWAIIRYAIHAAQ